MKKHGFLLLIFSMSINIVAQTCQWAKSAGGYNDDFAYTAATDANGNVYMAGMFNSDSIVFGAYVAHNIGISVGGDIFIVKYDSAGNVLWAKGAQGYGSDYPTAMAINGTGELYLTGYFYSPTLAFSSTVINHGPSSDADMFLVKMDGDGNTIWAKDYSGSTDYLQPSGIALDEAGMVYLVGTFASDSFMLGGTELFKSGFFNSFLAKTDTTGNVLWAKATNGSDKDQTYAVATDNTNGVYIAGTFTSPTLSFGATTLTDTNTASSASDIFLAKYDTAGTPVWAKRFGGAYSDDAFSVTTDHSGHVFISGYFNSPTINFGGVTLTNGGVINPFVTMLSSATGATQWAKSGYCVSSGNANCIKTDYRGNLYASGWYNSDSLSFDGNVVAGAGGDDIFLVRMDTLGNVLTALSAGGTNNDWCSTNAPDNDGDVYIAGFFASPTCRFGAVTVNNDTLSPYSDAYLAKYSFPNLSVGSQHNGGLEPIAIYPNPNTGSFTLNGIKAGTAVVNVYNAMGGLVYAGSFPAPASGLQVALPACAPGVYYLRCTTPYGTQNLPFAVK